MPHLLLSCANALYLFLPCLIPNLMVYLVYKYFGSEIAVTLDGGKSWRGQRIVGEGRGLEASILWIFLGAFIGLLQGDVERGLVIATGGQFGVVANSIIKRRLGLERGRSFFLTDHTDHLLGAFLFWYFSSDALPVISLTTGIKALVIAFAIHTLINLIIRPRIERTSSHIEF